jgi:hypothetical protein
MTPLINRILPFIFIGIAIVAFALGIMLLAYLFFFGAILGFILYLFFLIKQKFFPNKSLKKTHRRSGRIIDSKDWRNL